MAGDRGRCEYGRPDAAAGRAAVGRARADLQAAQSSVKGPYLASAGASGVWWENCRDFLDGMPQRALSEQMGLRKMWIAGHPGDCSLGTIDKGLCPSSSISCNSAVRCQRPSSQGFLRGCGSRLAKNGQWPLTDMKIALTGCSSTGKTTLAKRLVDIPPLTGHRFLPGDARGLLYEMGISLQAASQDDLMQFQRTYLAQKRRREEGCANYVVDRSYVDVAAYWVAYGLSTGGEDGFIRTCHSLAVQYDLHCYFPPDLLPFDADGFRGDDRDRRATVDRCIREFLEMWQLRFVSISTDEISTRLAAVESALVGDE